MDIFIAKMFPNGWLYKPGKHRICLDRILPGRTAANESTEHYTINNVLAIAGTVSL